MKNQAGYIIIGITIATGVCLAVAPASAQAFSFEEQKQERSPIDTLKTYIFSFGNGLHNRFGRKSKIESKTTTTVEVYPYDENANIPNVTQYNKSDSTPSKNTFWSKILTKVNNVYNNLGKTFGFPTIGNKEPTEKNSNTYNEQGAVNTFAETSKENPTITPAKSIDYNAAGETIVNTETNINLTPSTSPATPQVQRTQQPSITAPTPTRVPQINRSQTATPSPSASTQRC